MITLEKRIFQMVEETILKTQKVNVQLCNVFLGEEIDCCKNTEYLHSRFEEKFQKFLKSFYETEVFGDEETRKRLSQKIFENPQIEIHRLEEINSELPQIFKSQFYSFDVFLKLDNRAIQKILRDVNGNDLAMALKGECEELQNKFFRNMSKEAAEFIKEDMEFLSPVYKSTVISAQQKILDVVYKLKKSKDIAVPDYSAEDIILDI